MQPAARHAQLLDRLAAEYVLGTLRGSARARFERWRTGSSMVDDCARRWELRLTPLATRLRPMEPPSGTLAIIQRRLSLGPPRYLRWAPGLALALLLAALLPYGPSAHAPRPDQLAVIDNGAGAVQWQVEVYAQRARLVVRSPVLASKPADRDYELWALPAGAPAVSLGVMPVRGEFATRLSPGQRRALAQSAQVAVSVEPLGGSPTGHATGPVIFVAPLRNAG
jgi:anti-sigma-K factor RskA